MNRGAVPHALDLPSGPTIERLAELTALFDRLVSLEDLAWLVAEAGPEAIGADRAALWLLEKGAPDPVFVATFSGEGEADPIDRRGVRWRPGAGDPLAGPVGSLLAGTADRHVEEGARFEAWAGEKAGKGWLSKLGSGKGWCGLNVVRREGEPAGILVADNGLTGRAAGDGAADRLGLLAAACSLVIGRLDTEGKLDEVSELFEVTRGSVGEPMLLVSGRGEPIFVNEAGRKWLAELAEPLGERGPIDPTTGNPARSLHLALRTASGVTRHQELTAAPTQWKDEPAALLWLRDVTAEQQRESTLREAIRLDRLTHLPDRRWFLDRLKTLVHEGGERGGPDALLLVDLDKFREVNEAHGHEVGDQVLREVARRIQERLRDRDEAARIGDDEFAVLLLDVGRPDQALTVARRIAARIAEPIALTRGKSVQVTASIGVRLTPRGRESVGEFFAGAEAALVEARAGGELVLRRYEHPRRQVL